MSETMPLISELLKSVEPHAGQQRLDQRQQEVEQLARVCIHALTQRRAGGQQLDVQRLLEKDIARKFSIASKSNLLCTGRPR